MDKALPKISIIMPVYNSIEFLPEAIDSVLQQTYTDFELLLIDDGSTDGSGRVCDDYAKMDSRIVVVHQTNQGICKTRNFGLDMARGKYIAFIDNDDVYKNTLLEDNYTLITKYNCEVVKFGCILEKLDVSYQCTKIYKRTIKDFLVVTQMDSAKYYPMLKESFILNTIWNGLYLKEFLMDNCIRFHEKIRYGCDDQIFNMDMYSLAKKIVINPECYYTWYQRQSHSTSAKYYKDKKDELCLMCEREEQLVDKLEVLNDKSNKVSDFWYRRMAFYLVEALFMICGPVSPLNKEEQIKEIRYIMNWPVFNRYIGGQMCSRLLHMRDKRFFPVFFYYCHMARLLRFIAVKYSRYLEKR